MGLKIEVRSDEWLASHRHTVRCDRCRVSMNLRNTPHGVAYECPECRVRHGAHQKTGEPLGTPAADQETRQARIDAHEALDALWKGPGATMTRTEAYAYLAMRMGLTVAECHIGRFDAEQCRRAIAVCEEIG